MIASASRAGRDAVGDNNLADQQLDVEAEPGDARSPLNTSAARTPATNVPWPSVSRFHEPPMNDLPPSHTAREVRVAVVDARVDDRDRDLGQVRPPPARSPRRDPVRGTTAERHQSRARCANAVCRFLSGTARREPNRTLWARRPKWRSYAMSSRSSSPTTKRCSTLLELSPGLTAQHIVTAHCTIAPETMRAAAEMVERRGARFLDAPFTGSKFAAENGQLVYYIGGDEAVLKQVRPILEASSRDIILIGDQSATPHVMKVATNLITAATAQVAAEALAIVRRVGISAELFSRAMKSNASNSTTIEMKVPLMMAGDFEPHFSVKNMLKDVRIGTKLARDFALDLPVTEICRDMLLNELKQGRGDADYASIAQKYFPASAKIAKPKRGSVDRASNGRHGPSHRAFRDKTSGARAKPRAVSSRRGQTGEDPEPEPEKAPAAAQTRGGILGWLARRY